MELNHFRHLGTSMAEPLTNFDVGNFFLVVFNRQLTDQFITPLIIVYQTTWIRIHNLRANSLTIKVAFTNSISYTLTPNIKRNSSKKFALCLKNLLA